MSDVNERDGDEAPESDSHESKLGTKAGDLLKKAITVGIGAAFLTEESIRAVVGEMKLPKELVANLLSQANSTRSEFLGKFSHEVLERIQSRINPVDLITEVLRKNDFELTIKIKVKPKSEDKAKGEE
ncbi:MAG: hypothetical protein H7301_07445 [Cryobacterium sp.]|nr:hypothetical protein [Oligoflexia bacterium]